MGSKHYMVLMPSLVHQFFSKRSTVLSSEDFIFWIFSKYFGDGGATANIGSKKFQTVHLTLNSLLKEPFLERATEKTGRLVERLTPGLVGLDEREGREWAEVGNVVRIGDGDRMMAEVDLFPLLMNYVADVAANVLLVSLFRVEYRVSLLAGQNSLSVFEEQANTNRGFINRAIHSSRITQE